MLNPFLLKRQQDKLNKRLQLVGEKHEQANYKHVEGSSALISATITACNLHNAHIKTKKGFIKSLIPFTFEFKTRIICAKRITETHKKLDEIESAISNRKTKHHDKKIKKSYSDTEEVLQRNQYNRVLQPQRKVREAEDIISSLDYFHSPRLT